MGDVENMTGEQATNERPEAEFHDLVAYGRLAEVLGEHLRKARWSSYRADCTARAGRRRTAAIDAESS